MITQFHKARLLKREFGGVDYTIPATYYIGLSSTVIDEYGEEATEPNVIDGYSRKSVVNNEVNFDIVEGIMINKIPIIFSECLSSWDGISYGFISDHPTAGNILYYQNFAEVKNVGMNESFMIDVGDFTIDIV